MIPRSLILLTIIVHHISTQGVVLVEGGHLRRSSRIFRSQRRHDDLKRVYNHDSAQDVIYAPLDGERVITKGIYYVNGKSSKDDETYESILLHGNDATATNGIDPFFVTHPPPRTTIAVKYNVLDSTPRQFSNNVNGVEEEESLKITTTKYPLRLVTIPPRTTTPLPPFKHLNRRIISRKEDKNNSATAPTADGAYASQGWRSPSGILQIPPNPLLPADTNQYLSAPPPNPFLPIMPVKELNITYPFLPIGTNNPFPSYSSQSVVSPLGLPASITPPFRNNDMVHRSSLRHGSYVRGREVPVIPLPSTIGSSAIVSRSAYVRTDNDYAKEKLVDPEFLIDGESRFEPSVAASTNSDSSKHISIRSINGPFWDHHRDGDEENSSEQLRLFARNHPNIVKSMSKKTFVKENLLILPKSYSIAHQQPSSSNSRTSLTPNEKLDLCCRKRRVNPGCQAMCNFETLNDKTLVSAFLTNVCPGSQQRDAFDCASSKVDHSECCLRAGLLTFHGGKCLSYCRTNIAQPTNPLEFLPCLQVFEHIKACYREYQITHPNILGD